MIADLFDTGAAAIYAEGYRYGLAVLRQRGFADARKMLWALHHGCRPMSEEATEYAQGVIDALESAIQEGGNWR